MYEKKQKLIKSVMENYPEFSFGNCLKCKKWDYKNTLFVFVDEETEKEYSLDIKKLQKGFNILLNLALNGKYNNFQNMAIYDGGNWDCIDVDALVQCSIFGKVIYG